MNLSLEGEPDNVVMRFAPNPNGPLTIGHARGVVVNSMLAKKYGGKFIVRFDDTDPKTKKPLPQAYDWIIQDCEWLGAKPDLIVKASDRISLYYDYALKLIKQGNAYVCKCEVERFRQIKAAASECPCRGNSVDESMADWERMLADGFDEGDAVLRIKTDMRHKNPAIRDWVAFRIIKEPHPLVGDKYVVWPMLDFEGGIEDHLLEVTHIIRGKDLMDSEKRQEYVYGYLGWEYPKVIHWGRLKLADYGKFSTSQMGKDIGDGIYEGWDDYRLPTLRALRRRGILPEAVKESIIALGLSLTDISLSMENLYAVNRKMLDAKVNRYFFVKNPVELEVDGLCGKTVRLPLHPRDKPRGLREMTLDPGCEKHVLLIPGDDASNLNVGDKVKPIGLDSIEITRVGEHLAGRQLKERKGMKVHWLTRDNLDATIKEPEGDSTGICEKSCQDIPLGDTVQFERYGFARLESKDDKGLVFIFGHR